MPYRRLLGALLVLLGVAACTISLERLHREHYISRHPALLGGGATIDDSTRDAFSRPLPGLSRQEKRLFFVGNSFFNQSWVAAPASTTARDGLGPLFNSRSCAGCHFKDGRGRPPLQEGESPTGLLLRLSVAGAGDYGAPKPHPIYGGQLQSHAILGVLPEGSLSIHYTEINGQFADGTPYILLMPHYSINAPNYGDLPPDLLISPRVANQMIGLGLLEAIPEAAILANADPADADGDGISGKPNYVWDFLRGEVALGRFGWKANQPTLYQQVAAAFNGDIGITSSLFPDQNCTAQQVECRARRNGGTPEIEEDDLLKVVLYAQALAVPAARDAADPQVQHGKALFAAAGCHLCHTPSFTTGAHPIAALSGQVIQPYTDLLLHDMGGLLADNRTDYGADGREWRTPPLWGIGLFETVNGHTRYLHDGRARNLQEAILWHGGEAEQSKQYFLQLSQADREALLRFLRSL